jgi:hypothetical protein
MRTTSLVQQIALSQGFREQQDTDLFEQKIRELYQAIDDNRLLNNRLVAIRCLDFGVNTYYIPFEQRYAKFGVGDYLNGYMIISATRREAGKEQPYVYYVQL